MGGAGHRRRPPRSGRQGSARGSRPPRHGGSSHAGAVAVGEGSCCASREMSWRLGEEEGGVVVGVRGRRALNGGRARAGASCRTAVRVPADAGAGRRRSHRRSAGTRPCRRCCGTRPSMVPMIDGVRCGVAFLGDTPRCDGILRSSALPLWQLQGRQG